MRTNPHSKNPAMHRYGRGLVEYDSALKRVWIAGQRLHHGLAGALVAGAGLAGFAARRFTPRGGLEWTLVGSVLMAHDWHDRGHWFERGRQSQQ